MMLLLVRPMARPSNAPATTAKQRGGPDWLAQLRICYRRGPRYGIQGWVENLLGVGLTSDIFAAVAILIGLIYS